MSKFQAKEFKQFMDNLRQQTGLIRSFVSMADLPEIQKSEALRLHEENEARLSATLEALETADAADENRFNQYTRDFKTAFNQYFAHVKVMIREAIGAMRMFPPALLEQFESAIDEMHKKIDDMIRD